VPYNFELKWLEMKYGATYRCDMLKIGDMNPRVVVQNDSGVENVSWIKNVFDFPHQLHSFLTPLQRQKGSHVASGT
jgi:hypothetical protein